MTKHDLETLNNTEIDPDPIFEVYFDIYDKQGRTRDVLAYVRGSALLKNVQIASKSITIGGVSIPDSKIFGLSGEEGSHTVKILYTHKVEHGSKEDNPHEYDGYSFVAKLLTSAPPEGEEVYNKLYPLNARITACKLTHLNR